MDDKICFTVENLTRDSFWNVYQPGCTEHYVLHCFRSNPDFIPELSLVMEKAAAFEEYDRQFEYKEKLKLPGQLF